MTSALVVHESACGRAIGDEVRVCSKYLIVYTRSKLRKLSARILTGCDLASSLELRRIRTRA